MKKSQLFGLLAAAAAVVIFTGCPTDPDIEYRDVDKPYPVPGEPYPVPGADVPGPMIHIDYIFEDQEDLVAALENADYEDKVIGVGSEITLDAPVTIGKKYAVYILNGGNLETASGAGLTVEGTLWVGYGAALTVGDSSEPIVVDGGVVNVVTGGTLSIDSADSIQDAEGETALGTAAVSIVNGKLAYTDGSGFDTTTKIAAALGYITSGTLDVGEVELKPSEVTGITIPQNKSLIANTGDTDETATTLIIPAGLVLTTGDDLDSVTELTVYGTLTASSATLKSDGAALTVGANGSASIGAATLLTSTVEGSLTLNGDLTLDTDAVLTITAQAELSGSDKIKAAAGTITIVAEGVSYEGFTTDDTGVAADDFWTVAEALQADLNALTGDKTAEAESTSAVDVEIGGEGIEFSADTTIVEDEDANVATATDKDVIDDLTKITLSLDSTTLQLTDGDFAESSDVESVITFGDFRLANSGLISPKTEITVTLTTKRSS